MSSSSSSSSSSSICTSTIGSTYGSPVGQLFASSSRSRSSLHSSSISSRIAAAAADGEEDGEDVHHSVVSITSSMVSHAASRRSSRSAAHFYHRPSHSVHHSSHSDHQSANQSGHHWPQHQRAASHHSIHLESTFSNTNHSHSSSLISNAVLQRNTNSMIPNGQIIGHSSLPCTPALLAIQAHGNTVCNGNAHANQSFFLDNDSDCDDIVSLNAGHDDVDDAESNNNNNISNSHHRGSRHSIRHHHSDCNASLQEDSSHLINSSSSSSSSSSCSPSAPSISSLSVSSKSSILTVRSSHDSASSSRASLHRHFISNHHSGGQSNAQAPSIPLSPAETVARKQLLDICSAYLGKLVHQNDRKTTASIDGKANSRRHVPGTNGSSSASNDMDTAIMAFPAAFCSEHCINASELHSLLALLLRCSPASNDAILAAFIYLEYLTVKYAHCEAVPHSRNVSKLLLLAVLVAGKFLDDKFYNNAFYARLTGMPVTEVNALELKFLFITDFNLNIRRDSIDLYRDRLFKSYYSMVIVPQ